MYEINLSEVCEQTIQRMKDEKVIETLVSTTIENTVKECITSYFESYTFERAIGEKLNLKSAKIITSLGLDDFNKYILEIIEQVRVGKNEPIAKESVNIIFGNPIKEVKLSEILIRYKEYLENELDEDEKAKISEFEYKIEDSYFYRKVKLKSNDEESFEITIRRAQGKVSRTYKGEEVETLVKKVFRSRYNSEFELWLLKLEIDETKIIIDEDECKYIDTELRYMRRNNKMCNECNQYRCDIRCPNYTEEEKECCTECGSILEKGEEVLVNDDNEPLCTGCMDKLQTEDIIRFFNLQKEVV